jgi:hypothetical protein
MSYRNLARSTAELRMFAETGQWENASRVMEAIAAEIAACPAARPADRPALETALANLKEASEHAVPLHADIARLLAAFSGGRG